MIGNSKHLPTISKHCSKMYPGIVSLIGSSHINGLVSKEGE
jgi:hypothetical protein